VTRALDWDGCENVRDLGGLPLEQGGETRSGVLVRSDNVRKLTDAGWASLADHGVTRIVDLRLPEELDNDPPRELDLDVVHVSLVGGVDPAFHERIDEYEDDAGYWTWVYTWILENRRENIARVIAAIAEADGIVVVHCHAGKDRTGVVVAVALRAAGVPIDEIVADYALTGSFAPDWVDAAPDAKERVRRAWMTGSPPAAMAQALEHLDRELGGVDAYLLGAGLSDEQLARLRDRLAAA
jgi:protein-tyrosine phosphatase